MMESRNDMRPLEHLLTAKPEVFEEPHSKNSIPTALTSTREFVDLYRTLGWNPIPLVPCSKKSSVPWRTLQDERVSDEQAAQWWSDTRAGVGIICGAISGIVVVDIDGPEGEEAIAGFDLPETPTAVTGRGRHLYFAHPGDDVPNRSGVLPKVDVRGDGGYVVSPPSVHASGHIYAWAQGLSPDDVGLAECPAWVYGEDPSPKRDQSEAESPRNSSDWIARVQDGVNEGARNETTAALVGHLLSRRVQPRVTATLVHSWAQTMTAPPLPPDEVDRVIESIAAAELKKRKEG
jgi:hypothetical protein